MNLDLWWRFWMSDVQVFEAALATGRCLVTGATEVFVNTAPWWSRCDRYMVE